MVWSWRAVRFEFTVATCSDLVFKALGMTTEEARSRFGFFLDALEFGTPPHGGIAPGIERLMMVLVPTDNIRDVMAFPKTASATDLMIDAPGEVDPKQLEELHLRRLLMRLDATVDSEADVGRGFAAPMCETRLALCWRTLRIAELIRWLTPRVEA